MAIQMMTHLGCTIALGPADEELPRGVWMYLDVDEKHDRVFLSMDDLKRLAKMLRSIS
jgi:hypothetical protein